jgi:hypothetical protein
MPSPVTVKIKVDPHIKKYIIAQSENKIEPLVFHHKHVYAISLVHKVSNFNAHNHFKIDERGNVIEYLSPHKPDCNHVVIALPYSRAKDVRRFNYLSINAKRRFRSEVKDDFYFELIRFVIKRLRRNIPRKTAIQEFYNRYDITEDDLKLESIYRQTSRILEPFFQ